MNLATMYKYGQGVTQDYQQVVKWYLVVKANDRSAKIDKNLQDIESQMTPVQITVAQRMAREWWAAHHSGQ